MASSGMLRRVVLVRTDVSEELSPSFIRARRIGELVTLAVSSDRCILVILIMEAISSAETSVLTRVTRRNIPEDGVLRSHRRENLKSYILFMHATCPARCTLHSSICLEAFGKLCSVAKPLSARPSVSTRGPHPCTAAPESRVTANVHALTQTDD
jgi:hypothetical protein